MNALAQALAALAAPAPSPLTVLIAVEAIRELAAALPEIARRARGSRGAGSTRSTAPSWPAPPWPPSPIGLHHRLAHLIGGRYGLPHAGTHSALLPHVVTYARGDVSRTGWPRPGRPPGRRAGSARGCSTSRVRIGAPTSLADARAGRRRASPPSRPRSTRPFSPTPPGSAGRCSLTRTPAGARPTPSLGPRSQRSDGSERSEGSGGHRRLARPVRSRRRGGPGSTPTGSCCPRWIGSCAAESGASLTDYEVLVALSEAPRRPAADGARRRPHGGDPQRRHPHRGPAGRGAAGSAGRRRPTTSAASTRSSPTSGWQTIRSLAPGHVRSVRDTLIDLLDPADLGAVQRIGERVRRAPRARRSAESAA